MILIGLGSNIGDRKKNILTAIQKLSQHQKISLTNISSLYETKPVGVTNQPDFLNGAIHIDTTLSPLELLEVCLDVECQMGRVRDQRWGPRNIDIDILVYHDLMIQDEVLNVPHPRLCERAFVLIPLQEIAGEIKVDRGLTPGELLSRICDKSDVVLYEQLSLELLPL
ncbi:2-amino-4-hydroxy-6-hydroxymethyldihydropteridine diphosphokinase [Pelosinus sp. sgz500959]|uniref:2-amino-4-hydroxy-6- hydroxymethyldihydropteridine diphosphokinase n=1 Tax=Pelosinus sp. sgz500959 TaxID=3242472 RepID=UPI00366D87EA